MWNFLVGGLLAGSAIVLYDGQPDPRGLWELRRRGRRHLLRHQRRVHRRVHEGGRGAAGAAARCAASARPARRCRSRASSGSTSSSATCGCSPPAAAPTCAPRSWARVRCCRCAPASCRRARSARRSRRGTRTAAPLVGEVGELVITKPMPSMPLFFWNDPDGERYRESYFDMYPGIWRHGDWIKITERGSRGDLRALGLDHQPRRRAHGHERALLGDRGRGRRARQPRRGRGRPDRAVRRHRRRELDDELAAEIRRRVREHCSPRHVPDAIHRIDEVPRTLSNKKLEVPVKRILQGGDPGQGRQPRLARQPRRARLVRRAGGRAHASGSLRLRAGRSASRRSISSAQKPSARSQRLLVDASGRRSRAGRGR